MLPIMNLTTGWMISTGPYRKMLRNVILIKITIMIPYAVRSKAKEALGETTGKPVP
jgi:hypothetical protein